MWWLLLVVMTVRGWFLVSRMFSITRSRSIASRFAVAGVRAPSGTGGVSVATIGFMVAATATAGIVIAAMVAISTRAVSSTF